MKRSDAGKSSDASLRQKKTLRQNKLPSQYRNLTQLTVLTPLPTEKPPQTKILGENSVKTYRNHNCSRRHKSTRTFLKCAIPNNAWVAGQGHIAVIAWCRIPTVTLWANLEDALQSKSMIDDTACGGRCIRHHELVQVDIT